MVGRLATILCSLAAVIQLSLVAQPGWSKKPATFAETTPTPAPAMPPFPERLAPPPTVYPARQADEGAQVYYLVCMACHGDKGQGLTEEWRNVLDPADRNCWQSKCHAANHPPEGFVLPKYVPPAVGPGLLSEYGTALNLHDFLKARMPWQAPGRLSEEEYWQLTAFLIRQNGLDPGDMPLDPQSAKLLSLKPEPTVTPTPEALWEPLMGYLGDNTQVVVGTGILLVLGLAIGVIWVLIARGTSPK